MGAPGTGAGADVRPGGRARRVVGLVLAAAALLVLPGLFWLRFMAPRTAQTALDLLQGPVWRTDVVRCERYAPGWRSGVSYAFEREGAGTWGW